ncbi:hypothetical protein HK102_008716, partial [Quaeritorhiza haematococci]
MLPRTAAAPLRSFLRSRAAAEASQCRRAYAVLSNEFSSVNYTRKGDQVPSAPLAKRTVSKTSNGVTIATYDDMGPVSSLAIVVQAGSRNETSDFPGVAHMLKNSLIRVRQGVSVDIWDGTIDRVNIQGDNIVRTIRETELRGDTLYTSLTRENIVLASDFLRDDLVDVVPALVNNFVNAKYEPYEFFEARSKTVAETEASLADPTVKIFDELHRVAFRNGLGNSQFASKEAVKNLKRAHLHEFISKYFTSDRIAIVGRGVAHSDLKALAEEALTGKKVSSTKTETAPSQYFGGEVRIDAGPKAATHYAVAYPSVAFTSQDYAASLVLQALLDGTSHLKWGSASGATGLLANVATANTTVSTFNAAYSDAGLLGFYVNGAASEIKSVVQKSVDAFKTVAASPVSDAHISRAKKAAIVFADGGAQSVARDEAVRELGVQALANGSVSSSAELADVIGKVTASDVSQLAKKLVSAKPSVVAYGNARSVPYIDEFK